MAFGNALVHSKIFTSVLHDGHRLLFGNKDPPKVPFEVIVCLSASPFALLMPIWMKIIQSGTDYQISVYCVAQH